MQKLQVFGQVNTLENVLIMWPCTQNGSQNDGGRLLWRTLQLS